MSWDGGVGRCRGTETSADVVPAKAGTQVSTQLIRKVFPIGIYLFDQADLPSAIPFLDAFFALNRLVHIGMQLEVHEDFYAVFPCEAINRAGTVCFDPTGKVAGDPDVQRPVAFAGEDTHGGLLHSNTNVEASRDVDAKDWVPAFAGTAGSNSSEIPSGGSPRPTAPTIRAPCRRRRLRRVARRAAIRACPRRGA